jgi:hypothetical protein
MNLYLTPEQFLALYNSLGVHLSSADPETPGWTGVEEIRKKMEESLLDLLTSANDTKNKKTFVKWLDQEKERIHQLEDDLTSIKVSTSKDDAKKPAYSKKKSA